MDDGNGKGGVEWIPAWLREEFQVGTSDHVKTLLVWLSPFDRSRERNFEEKASLDTKFLYSFEAIHHCVSLSTSVFVCCDWDWETFQRKNSDSTTSSSYSVLRLQALSHSEASIEMLASLLAPYITGRYDVTCVPIALPSALVTILLPSLWSDGAPIFLTDQELRDAQLERVPDPGQGKRWAMIEVGEQIGTGVGFGPGRKTF